MSRRQHRRTLPRLLAALAAIATVATPLVVVTSPEPSSAAVAEFDPPPNATSVGPSAFGQVVTDGEGTFLSVHRVELPLGQYIGIRRSSDGGQTWTTVALFDGGGGVAPVIDASGRFAAVAFIAQWCDPAVPDLCYQAPHLATSDDHGGSWSAPRRVDLQARRLRVAQDGERTWLAWERFASGGATVELRGTRDGGSTWFASRSVTGSAVEVAASGGLAVAAFTTPVGQGFPQALVARGDVIADPPSPLADPFGDVSVRTIGAAVADGRMHVLTTSSPVGTFSTFRRTIEVRTAGVDGVFDTVHPVGDDNAWTASIAAELGTVAVAVGEQDGVTSVATSGNGGTTFSTPVPVTATDDGTAPTVRLGLTVRPPDRPIARFSWRVAERLVDDDGDGFVDPANDSGDPSLDALRVYGGRSMEVTIDGCSSIVPTGRDVASYRWTQILPDGTTDVLPFGACRETLTFDSGERMTLRFDVTDTAGERASTVQVLEPRDLVVVSMGDSVASGEGNPHVPVGILPAVWQDGPCHRSATAGPALAARRLEASDPHTSVTFIQLACSGAAIVDSPEVPGTDDPATGGVLDSYQGQEPQSGSLRPSQVDQLTELLGIREIDALMLSIGANDAQFSTTLIDCIEVSHCERTSVRTDFEQRLATLPDRFARLATAIGDLGVAPSDVHITEYFDPTQDELGVVQLRCAVTGGLLDLLDDDEARWAATGVTGGINAAVGAAATTHGWRYVGGIAREYARHGYCSTDPYLVTIAESVTTQGNEDGAFHPNAPGHGIYADALHRSLRTALLVPPADGNDDGAGVGRQALGELMVTSSTSSSITLTSLRDTGGAPALLGSRVIDRVVSGNGGLGVAGPPAVGSAAAVGVWTQLPDLWSTITEEWAAQLAVSPNLAVRDVQVVQAPTRETWLVAGRETVVLADIEATIDGPIDAAVDVFVATAPDPDDPDAPPGRPILSTTSTVRLRPGMNRVVLPKDETFTLAAGELPIATVTVTDPMGADPADDLDDTFTDDPASDDDRVRGTLESRPLTLEFVNATVPDQDPVACDDLAEIARRQLAFARAALPVADPGILAVLGCGDLPPIEDTTERDVLAYLGMLDWVARHAEVDAIVAVVPPGWLQDVAGGAVGAAAAGSRGIVIEQSAPALTLAHEIAHSFGVTEHVAATSKVAGVRVDQSRYLEGIDWMAERTPSKAWTGAGTWDFLAVAFGPQGGPPAPPDPLSDQLDVNGTIDAEGNHQPSPWTPGDTGSPRDLDLEGLELERLLVEQMDGTSVLTSDPVPLAPAEGLYAPDAEPTGPIGWTYSTRLTLLPATTSVRLVLDGVVVDERPVTAVPEVTVTAPTGGTVVGRGEALTVEWSTAAPVGPTSTASVFASQDGGDTWKPLAIGVTGTSADVTIPRDMVNGPAVIRVVVTDGLRAGRGDSAEITVRAPITVLPEQVVAVRHDQVDLSVPGATLPPYPGDGLWIMDTDGTDLREIVPLVAPVDGQGGMVPLHPDWRGDAGAIAFDGEVSGRRDLYVVAPDGSGLRPITSASSDEGRQFACADWHPDGVRILALSGPTMGVNEALQLVSVDSTTGAVTRLGWSAGNLARSVWDRPCPRWSDDGNEILLAVDNRSGTAASGAETRVFVIDVATMQSKYAYSVNSGSLEGVAPNTWLDFAPGDTDRFLDTTRLFSQGYLNVVEPRSTFIVDKQVPIPKIVWRTNSVSPISQSGPLFGSAGFDESGTSVWFTSTNEMTPVAPQPVGHFCRMSVGPFAPDPVFSAPPLTPGVASCYAPGGDGTPVDAVDSAGDQPTVGIIHADVHPGITRTDDQAPIVIEDPSTLPPDPDDPPAGDVTDATPPQDPAPGADDVAPGPVPAPVAATVVVTAGAPETLVVRTADGTPTAVTVAVPPPAETVDVEPIPFGDGELVITPAAGFLGRTTFEVRAPGSDATVTITVDVVPAPAPTAVPDTLTIAVGTPTMVDPVDLLANDVPIEVPESLATRSVGGVRIVSVYGFTAGTAVLDREGTIEVVLDDPAGGTFTYVIADATGATAAAEVAVLAPVAPTTTTTTTTPPATTAPATTAPSAPITPPPTTARPAVGPGLPATGSDPVSALRVAGVVLAVGIAVMALARHRPRSA